MPIAGTVFGDPLRGAGRRTGVVGQASNRQRVNDALVVILRLVADNDCSSVGRDSMVIVAAGGESGIDFLDSAADPRNLVEQSLTVVDKSLAIWSPVGGFHMLGKDVDNAAIGTRDVNGFESAEKGSGPELLLFDGDLVEFGGLGEVGFVRTNPDANIVGLLEIELDRSSAVSAVETGNHCVPPFGELRKEWFREASLDFVRSSTLAVAVLEAGEPISVESDVSIGAVSIERLADNKTGFGVWVLRFAKEPDLGFDALIAAHFLIGEVECVFIEPHVRPAAVNHIGLCFFFKDN